MKKIWQTVKGLYSLFVGLFITGRYMTMPHVTVYYPREVDPPETLASYRGPLELVADPALEEPGKSRCISCQMCVKACPSQCLTVVKGDGGKQPGEWTYDFSLCSLCGSCVEVCPASALRFSHEVYLVVEDRRALRMNLLAQLAERLRKLEAA